MVACDHAIRTCGLPAMVLWERLLPHKPNVYVHEDNMAMIQVMRHGRNPTMRHLGRAHRVSVSFLHEQFDDGDFVLCYEVSSRMAADIYTKAFTDPIKWQVVLELINVFDPTKLSDLKYLSNVLESSPSQSGGGGPSSELHSSSGRYATQ